MGNQSLHLPKSTKSCGERTKSIQERGWWWSRCVTSRLIIAYGWISLSFLASEVIVANFLRFLETNHELNGWDGRLLFFFSSSTLLIHLVRYRLSREMISSSVTARLGSGWSLQRSRLTSEILVIKIFSILKIKSNRSECIDRVFSFEDDDFFFLSIKK